MKPSALCLRLIVWGSLGLPTERLLAMEKPTNVSSRAAEVFSAPQVRALAEAAARGNVAVLERLVKEGANINASGIEGVTPAWWAIRNRNKEGFAWLLAHGANPNPEVKSITIMEMAAGYDDAGFLEIALRHKPDLNRAGSYTARTPLQTAIAFSARKNFELLLNAGVNIDDDRGQSPLSFAAGQSRYEYVYMMLQAGVDSGRVSSSGLRALAKTVGNCYINPNSEAYEWRERVVRFLRGKEVEVHLPPNEGPRTKPLPVDLR
jgi:uncharacterized protein